MVSTRRTKFGSRTISFRGFEERGDEKLINSNERDDRTRSGDRRPSAAGDATDELRHGLSRVCPRRVAIGKIDGVRDVKVSLNEAWLRFSSRPRTVSRLSKYERRSARTGLYAEGSRSWSCRHPRGSRGHTVTQCQRIRRLVRTARRIGCAGQRDGASEVEIRAASSAQREPPRF